jgi:hypothetical protein
MKSQTEKLKDVKNAVEAALELKDISHETRIDEFCMARQIFVLVSFKRVSVNHTLIMGCIGRSRSGFYYLHKQAKDLIASSKIYRDIYSSILDELKLY